MDERLIAFFGRFPGERALAFMTVCALVVGSFLLGNPRGEASLPVEMGLVAEVPDSPQIQFADAKPTVEPDISTDLLLVTDNDPDVEDEAVFSVVNLQPQPLDEEPNTPGGILPHNRVLAFYGFPGNPEMGILGEYNMLRLLELLREQAEVYEEADPSRPVLIAFEVIASVAQEEPMEDGSFLLDTPSSVLNEYTQFTEENALLLILDVQVGRRTVENDVVGLRPWLAQEHVHLAIDPEFAMEEDQIPGEQWGSVDAADIRWAQDWLVNLALEESIPPKMLVVHQFIESMITNKDQIVPIQGVQLVIDADGWGPPAQKRVTYDVVNRQVPIEYAGIKLFYALDNPMMTPEEVVALDPEPLFVMYQ